MYRQFVLKVKEVEIVGRILCDFSLHIRVEFNETSKTLLASGYKNVNLGVVQYPETTIREKQRASVEVLDVAKWLFGVKPESIELSEAVEEQGDNERLSRFRKTLGAGYFNEESLPVQLELWS